MSMFTLAISCLTTSNLSWFMDLTFQVPMQIALYSTGLYFHHQSHPQLGVVFTLALSLHSFWSYFSTFLWWYIKHPPTWGVHLSVPYLFVFSYCSWGIKNARRNINNLRYAEYTTLLAESEKELKSLLMKVEEESEKADLKLNIHLIPSLHGK